MPEDKIKDLYSMVQSTGAFSDEKEFRNFAKDTNNFDDIFDMVKSTGAFTDKKEFDAWAADLKKKPLPYGSNISTSPSDIAESITNPVKTFEFGQPKNTPELTPKTYNWKQPGETITEEPKINTDYSVGKTYKSVADVKKDNEINSLHDEIAKLPEVNAWNLAGVLGMKYKELKTLIGDTGDTNTIIPINAAFQIADYVKNQDDLKKANTPPETFQEWAGADYEKLVSTSYGGRQLDGFVQSVQKLNRGLFGESGGVLQSAGDILNGAIGSVFSIMPAGQAFMAGQELLIQGTNAVQAAIDKDPKIFTENKGTIGKSIEFLSTLPSQVVENSGLKSSLPEGVGDNVGEFLNTAFILFALHKAGTVINSVKSNANKPVVFDSKSYFKLKKEAESLNNIADKIIKNEKLTNQDINAVAKTVDDILKDPDPINDFIKNSPYLSPEAKKEYFEKDAMRRLKQELTDESVDSKFENPIDKATGKIDVPKETVENIDEIMGRKKPDGKAVAKSSKTPDYQA